MKKHNKGITLIALVITIIVLLILAGISIAMLTGENGILTKADTAGKTTERQNIIEQAKLAILEYESENEGKITDEKAYEIIAKFDKNYKENEAFEFHTNENGDEYIETEKGYHILVSEIWKKQWYTFTLDGNSYRAIVGESLADWFARHRDENGPAELEETYGAAADLYDYCNLYELKDSSDGIVHFVSGGFNYHLLNRAREYPYYWDTRLQIKDGDEYIVDC